MTAPIDLPHPSLTSRGVHVPDLATALAVMRIGAAVQPVVLGAAARVSCQPLDRTRDGRRVPCVPEQGTQTAAYPMKRRIAIAMAVDQAESWGRRLGARLTTKTRNMTHRHLVEQQLDNPAVAAGAVEARVVALELCQGRPQDAYGAEGKPERRDFGSCPERQPAFNALGLCPRCSGEY